MNYMHTILTKLTLVSFVKMLVDVIRIYFVNSNTSVQKVYNSISEDSSDNNSSNF